jgi:hypothetical protein
MCALSFESTVMELSLPISPALSTVSSIQLATLIVEERRSESLRAPLRTPDARMRTATNVAAKTNIAT